MSKTSYHRTARFTAALGACVCAVSLAGTALAHKTFLAPHQMVWEAGETITVSFTSALAYPDLQFAIGADRIESAAAHVAHEAVESLSYEEADASLEISFDTQAQGYGVLAVTTHPRSGEIPPEDVALYFEELDADHAVRDRFDALPGDPALVRSYAKLSKTVFCVAECGGGGRVFSPLGHALEFVPVQGDSRSFTLFREGEPLGDHRVFIDTVDGQLHHARTNAAGRFEVTEAVTGTVLMSAVWIDVPEAADGTYHSDQASLTIHLD